VGVSQTLQRGTRNGITELSQRAPFIFGWAAITLGIGPHSSVDVAYCYRPSSVVCWSVTVVNHAKTAEPIEMPFGLRTRIGPRNHMLDGGPGHSWEG